MIEFKEVGKNYGFQKVLHQVNFHIKKENSLHWLDYSVLEKQQSQK